MNHDTSIVGDTFFLPYQRRWIRDTSRLKVMEKSRQIGMTWTTAYSAVQRTAAAGARLDCWVSSRDEMQARLFLEDCAAFARLLNVPAALFGHEILDTGARSSQLELRFSNGRRIHSLSSNADAQAGKRGGRILDEFALNPEPRQLYAIAYPGITWGGQLEVISTHRGSGNFFNQLVRDIVEEGNPKGFSHHRVTLLDAIEQGFLKRLQAKLPEDDPRKGMSEDTYLQFIKDGCPDEESWQQEYLCQPADDNSAFLTWEQITRCEYGASEVWESLEEKGSREYFAGVDIAREHDLTVMWVLELAGGVFLTRRVECLQRCPFSVQESFLNDLMENPLVRRVSIDQTGLGRQFAERATERYGRHRVNGITLTAAMKEALAYPLRSAFEDGKIRIPQASAIRTDLRAVRQESTAAGNIRITAERGKHGHSDRFWALALAIHAAGPSRRSRGWEAIGRDEAWSDPEGRGHGRQILL